MTKTKMDRRAFLTRSLTQVSGTALAAGVLANCAHRPPPAGREPVGPNVLFIAVDDLNDWAGCLGGHPDAKTPHIDALAERGVLFTNAHCPAPLCNASRAALMTGIRPSTSGVYSNSQPWRNSPVLADAVTLPQHFMAHGYAALGSGKIYHGRFPDPPSWQEYWPSKLITMPPSPALKDTAPGGRKHFNWGPVEVPNEEMGDWQVADWVSSQLQARHDAPFFLGCGIFRPHLPWHVPPKYFDLYPLEEITLPNVKEDDLEDVPEMGRRFANPGGDHARVMDNNAWRQAVQGYLASISFADDCVGRVIGALDNSPYRGNTIIVLWSDHGWHLGEKLHWRKFALWEEATRNVLMMAGPGIAPGERCAAPVNLLDIYPTLIDLCGLDPKEELEGDSLRPLLEAPQADWGRPTLTTFGRNNHSVRSARWRYTRYADGTEELYDHAVDAMEWNNLALDRRYEKVKNWHRTWLPERNAEAF